MSHKYRVGSVSLLLVGGRCLVFDPGKYLEVSLVAQSLSLLDFLFKFSDETKGEIAF